MSKNTLTIIDKYKQYFPIIAKLLGSGILTSLGFVLLSSGKIDYISKELSIKILLFIQFQIIGLTIVKYGLDTLVFAKMLETKESIYNPIEYIKKRGVLLSLLCAIVYIIMYDYQMAIVVFLTIILDVYSVISIVQMNVLKHYNYSFFANLVSYPLFFLVLLVSSLFFEYEYWQMILLYVLCIFSRFLLSWRFINSQKKLEGTHQLHLEIPINLGIQQILNFSLFKIDQIIISLGAAIMIVLGLSEVDIQQILFLTRFPELVSGVLVSLSFLYAPYLVIDDSHKLMDVLGKYKWYFLLYIVGLLLVFGVYLFIWEGEENINIFYVVTYFLVSVLALFVNMITLGYMKKSKVNNLVKNLLISNLLGLSIGVVGYFLGLGKYVVGIVAIQMIVFLILRLKDKK